MSALYRVDFDAADNEDFRYAFVLTTPQGAPADLTGATFKMSIARFEGPTVIELSSANGRIVPTLAQGRIDLIVAAADLAGLAQGFHTHDLVMTQGQKVTRLWTGGLSLTHGVTQ